MLDSPVLTLLASGGAAFLLPSCSPRCSGGCGSGSACSTTRTGGAELQARAVPKAGGAAVLTATLVTLTVGAALWPGLTSFSFLAQDARFWSLVAAASFMGLVGLIDDSRDLRGRHKLLGQLVAVSMLVFRRLVHRHPPPVRLESSSACSASPFTVFWLLACINALNLIDGMDGLLGSVGAIICLALAVMAPGRQAWRAAAVAGPGRGPGRLPVLQLAAGVASSSGDCGQHAHRPGRRRAGHPELA